MSRCAASAGPATSITQKLTRHRDILHEFTQYVYSAFMFMYNVVVSSLKRMNMWRCKLLKYIYFVVHDAL
ncbi:hypothetical protein AAHE18_18G132800 [Arachis hypogaea]